MKQERLIWVDRMRGLAILSVVIQHLSYCYENAFVYRQLIDVSNMGVFFFISGYILQQTAHIESVQDSIRFLWKKTIQLLLPFLVWPLIVKNYFFQTDWQLPTLQNITNEFLNPHLWFLLTLYSYCFYFVIGRFVYKIGG